LNPQETSLNLVGSNSQDCLFHSCCLSIALSVSVPNPHAVYVRGSAAIPNGADGCTNVGDAKEFRFNYDGGVFKLPYDRITSMEITEKAGFKAHLSVLVSWVPKVGKKPRASC